MYILRHYANATINLTKHALAFQLFACLAWLWDMAVWTNDSLDLVLRRSRNVRCNCCGWKGNRFFLQTHITGTRVYRSREMCPKCLSLGRQRQLAQYLTDYTRLLSLDSPRILEIGPSRADVQWLRRQGLKNIVIVDIIYGAASIIMDITRAAFKDNVFDAVICSHVLEHVPSDTMALKEILRVMKTGGVCVIQVPIQTGLQDTLEYGIPRPNEFGHVRAYGADFTSRLRSAGFEVVHTREGLFEVTKTGP